jgi:hypothetical protein
MKYDFNTYILSKLNEETSEEDLNISDNFILDPEDPSTLKDGAKGKITGHKTNNKDYKKLLKQFQNGKKGWWVKPDGKHVYYVNNTDLKKEIENAHKTKSTSNNHKEFDINEYDESKFKLMGKTLAYRSALGCALYGDRFRDMARDVLKDDSEYSIKQLYQIEDLFELAAAIKTVKGIKKREEKNQEIVSKCDETLGNLENEGTRHVTIKTIEKDYAKDFKTNYAIYEEAYNEGIKEQQKEMSKPDFEWKDPATGAPPTGAGKLNKWVGKGLANLGSLAEKIGNSIPREHNLENDMARLAVFGVKGMMLLAKGVTNLLKVGANFINNKRAFKKENKTKRFDDVKKKIDTFNNEFNTWLKTKNESVTLNEADDKKRKEFLQKFDDLMYSEILPYYFYKLSVIVDSFENNENMYLLKETDDGWSTFNTSSGSKTIVEDNSILMNDIVKYVNKNLKNALEEFKDESTKDIFRAIPKDIQYNSNIENNFKNWCDNLKTDTKLIEYLNVYNQDIIRQKFSKYSELTSYFNTVESATKSLEGVVKPLKNATLEFKDKNKKYVVPGIIVRAAKVDDPEEDDTDEENDSIDVDTDDLNNQFDSIQKEIEGLKEINDNDNKLNKMNDVTNKLDDINSKIQSTYDSLWKMVEKKPNKEEFKQYTVDKDKTPIFKKIINVKAIMSKLGIKESTVLNSIKELLLEDTGNKELDNIKKELKNLLDKKFEDGDITKYDEIAKNIKNIEGADEKIKERPELLFALGDDAKPEDKAKTQEYVKQTKNILDNIDVEHISDEKFYDKLKAEFDKTEDGILDWCKNNEKRLELYTNKELPNDIKEDIIPKLWNAKSFLTTVSNELNDSYNPFYDYDFIMLLEADENEQGKNTEGLGDRVKKGCEAINTLFATNKESEFITKYKDWKNNVINLVKDFGDKIQNKDNLKDPIQMLTAMCVTLKKEKEGGEQPKQENGNKPQETKQEGNQEGNQNTQQGQSSAKS